MSVLFSERWFDYRLVLGVTLILVAVGPSAVAQSGGSRPIEFSAPRGVEESSTNSLRFRSSLRGSGNLDEELSKRFDFFDLENSLSGVSAFRPAARPQTIVRQSRNANNVNGESSWLTHESLNGGTDGSKSNLPFDSTDSKDSEQAAVNDEDDRAKMLDSLRGEDWLVRGTMGDTFWAAPIPQDKEKGAQKLWEIGLSADSEGGLQVQEKDEFRPPLEGLFGQTIEPPQTFEIQDNRPSRLVRNDETRNFGQGFRRSDDSNNRDAFRELIGLEARPSQDYSTTFPNSMHDGLANGSAPTFAPSYTQPALSGVPTGFGTPQSSFQPVRPPDWNSMFQSPQGIQNRPNSLQSFDPVAPSNPSSSSDKGLSNPFYQPPRRQY